MTSRFFLGLTPAELAARLDAEDQTAGLCKADWNIAPRAIVPVLWLTFDGRRLLLPFRLGIAAGRKPTGGAQEVTGARAETLGRVAYLQHAFKAGRGAMPLCGHYTWGRQVGHGPDAKRQPYAVGRRDGGLMLAAAICDDTDAGRGDGIRRAAILTLPDPERDATGGRLPALLDDDSQTPWLDRRPAELDKLRKLLRVLPAAEMRRWPVSARVNDTRNNGPDLLDPVEIGR